MTNIANKLGKAAVSGVLAMSLVSASVVPSHARGHKTAVPAGTMLPGTAIIGAGKGR